MSVTEQGVVEPIECQSSESAVPVVESLEGREVHLGKLPVVRVLPLRQRRMVGPWCFIDRFGPLTFQGNLMDVAPHPHIGLQTVTWLLDGEILHDDSLGCQTVTRPSGVSVMTAGAGIAHSERTPEVNSQRLDGVQLWVALPEAARNGKPGFATIDRVPLLNFPGGKVQIFAGSAMGHASEAPHHSSIVGMEIELWPHQSLEIPLTPGWEHAALVMRGDVALEKAELVARRLHYLGTHRQSAALSSRDGGRLLILGGLPFLEKILMWWNFVARTPEELIAAREDWVEHRRFSEVKAYRGPRLDAPSLAGFRLRTPG